MNVITTGVMDDLDKLIDHVSGEAGIKGCVVISGKDSFSAGADLTMLQASAGEFAKLLRTQGEEAANQFLLDNSARLTRIYRRLETCGSRSRPPCTAPASAALSSWRSPAISASSRTMPRRASDCRRSRWASSRPPVARSAFPA